MKKAFVKALIELAEKDDRIMLLTGDLGFMALEPFRDRFPKRFFNVGVAEQNMVGLATGLAEAGLMPFVYSIVTFASLRPYEFIRNGPILHKFPVRIVGVGGGFEYGHNGITHYGLEDIAVMRAQPGITVIAPADHEQAYAAILKSRDLPGPVYYRLGKDDNTVVPGLKGKFELGKAQVVRDGSDMAFLAAGPIVGEALTAAEMLGKEKKISSSVVVISSVTPPPTEDIVNILKRVPLAVTVEAHYASGGIGSLVSEIASENAVKCKIVRCAVKSAVAGTSGSQAYMYERYGLSAKKLFEAVINEKILSSN